MDVLRNSFGDLNSPSILIAANLIIKSYIYSTIFIVVDTFAKPPTNPAILAVTNTLAKLFTNPDAIFEE